MNTLEVSLHATTKPTNGANTMKTQGRWGSRTHAGEILEAQGLSVWINGIHRTPQSPQWDEEATAEDSCHLTQPLLGDVFQIEGGAR